MQETRIQFGRTDLVKKFVEVQQAPNVLQTKFEHPPLKHLLSTYVIRPVACDTLPYYIHHRNKQTVILQQHEKNTMRRSQKDGEVDQLDEESAAQEPPQAEEESSSEEVDEDGFEMVTTEKKRDKVKAKDKKDFEPKKADLPEVAADPRFPASDPTKVKVIVVSQKPKTARKFEKREDGTSIIEKKADGEQKTATEKPAPVPVSTVDYSSMMGAAGGASDSINQKADSNTTETAAAAKEDKQKKVEESKAAKPEPVKNEPAAK